MSDCRHPKTKIELYISEEQGGVWAECQVCKAHTAVFDTDEEALSALRRMKRAKPAGAPTNKGGRPKELPADAKLASFMLCTSHKKTLDDYKKHNSLDNRSEALRHLLENIPRELIGKA